MLVLVWLSHPTICDFKQCEGFAVINSGKFVLALYLILVFSILPLLSPLRALGIMEPGLLRNAVLPPLLLVMTLVFGVGYLVRPRTYLHLVLLAMFFISFIVGLKNLGDEGATRAYFSHLFQIISSYILLGIGWKLFDKLSVVFWKRLIYLSLIATLVSTALTIRALGEGEIGRFYTPAYGFILIYSFGIVFSRKVSIISFFGAIVSNKRGVIVSIVLMLGAQVFHSARVQGLSKKGLVKGGLIGVIGLIAVSLGSAALWMWASSPKNENYALAQAVNITYNRMSETLSPSGEENLNQITAGRINEVQAAIESLDGIDYLLGSGAGWRIDVGGDYEVQNIHFSPLSITAVYGMPAALSLYLVLSTLVFKGLVRRDVYNLTITERMAPFYILGALVHSLVAYSLFIDWMVFFFSGVLIRSIHVQTLKNRGRA